MARQPFYFFYYRENALHYEGKKGKIVKQITDADHVCETEGVRIMALSRKPVTGMKDILPEEMKIRDYVTGVIRRPTGRSDLPPLRPPVWST